MASNPPVVEAALPQRPGAAWASVAVRRVARIALWLVLAAWSLLLVAWLSLHWFILPHIQQWRPQIEARASQALGVAVRIGSIEVQSNRWMPAVELRDVALLDAEQRVALRLPHVVAAISSRSLLALELRLDQLLIDGAELDIRRAADGRISVAGLDFGSGSSDTGDGAAADWFFKQHELVIRGGALRWIDEQRPVPPLVLSDVQLVVRNGFRQHDVRIDATPPADWGDRFTLQGVFTRSLLARRGDWRHWSGSAYADLPRADVRELRRHIELPFELSQGNGAVRAWFEVRDGDPRALTIDLALRAVALRLGRNLEPLVFENVEGRLVAERTQDRVAVELRHFGFLTGDGVRWPQGDLKLAWQQRDGQDVSGGDFSAQRLDLGVMAQIATRIPLGAALRKLLAEVRPRGRIGNLTASWQGPIDAPERYQVNATLDGLSLASGPAVRADVVGRPGLQNASLRLHASEAGGQARLDIADGAIELPGVFADPLLLLSRLDAELAWKIEPARPGVAPALSVQVKDAHFANADASGELSATWRSGAAVDSAGARGMGSHRNGAVSAPAGGAGARSNPASHLGARSGPYPGHLELVGALANGVAARTARYLPLGLPDATRRYLERAVRGGTITKASFRVNGDLADFPFRNPRAGARDGEFRVDAKLDGVTFAYVPSPLPSPLPSPVPGPATAATTAGGGPATAAGAWPPLTAASGELVLDRTALEIRDVRARLGGVEWSHGRAAIAELGEHAVVSVDAAGRGPLADMLRFVDATPISGWTGRVLSAASAAGAAELKLGLSIPLDGVAESSVKGSLVLAGNDIRMTPGTPLLGSARGRVDFTQKGFAVVGANARVLGGDLSFDGASQGADAQRFSGQGTFAADALRRASELGVLARIGGVLSGQAAYRINLAFLKGLPQLTLTSNLSGIAIDLPAPLAKAAPTALALRYQTTLLADSLGAGKTPRETVQLELGNALQARFLRELVGDEPRVLRGEVRVADGLPAAGAAAWGATPIPADPSSAAASVSASVDLRLLDLDAWQAAAARLAGDPVRGAEPARGAAALPDSGAAPPPGATSYRPDTIALRIGELRTGSRRLTHLAGTLSEQAGTWRATVDADQLAGYVEYRTPRRAGGGAGRVYARLARLSLPKGDPGPVETLIEREPTTASLPALDIVVDALELRGRSLGRLEIEAANRLAAPARSASREWLLSKFNLTTPEAQLVGSGTWGAAEPATGSVAPAARRVALNFKLVLGDSGALLARLGMPNVIRGGKGQLVGDLAWAGSPLTPDVGRMQGQLNLAIDAGQFLKVNAGAARLLGLLSMQSLPRRLTLDFRDLFQDGFSFDNVIGDLRIGQGQATTNNLRMRGTAAAVLLEGSADLMRETEDLRVVVVPEINAGTASLAYAMINPAIGLGTFLAQLLLRKPLIAAGTREFHVTGPWDDPKVERVERRRTDQASTTTPLASPEGSAEPVTR